MLYSGPLRMTWPFFSHSIFGLGRPLTLQRTEYVDWLEAMVALVGGYSMNRGDSEIISTHYLMKTKSENDLSIPEC